MCVDTAGSVILLTMLPHRSYQPCLTLRTHWTVLDCTEKQLWSCGTTIPFILRGCSPFMCSVNRCQSGFKSQKFLVAAMDEKIENRNSMIGRKYSIVGVTLDAVVNVTNYIQRVAYFPLLECGRCSAVSPILNCVAGDIEQFANQFPCQS